MINISYSLIISRYLYIILTPFLYWFLIPAMPEKLKKTLDLSRTPPFSSGPWLGGVLEVSGDVGFERMKIRRRDRTYPYARPVIRFGDKDAERVAQLHAILGGRIAAANDTRKLGTW